MDYGLVVWATRAAGRRLRFLFILFCLPRALGAQDGFVRDIEDGRRAELAAALAERGIVSETRELFSQFGAFGASVHALFNAGEGGAPFVIAMPLYGSGDESGLRRYDLNEGLLLAEKLKRQPLKAEIRIAFLGSGYSRLPPDIEAPRYGGLEDLLSLYPETVNLFYLDIPVPPGGLLLHHGSRGNLSPLELVRPFSGLCEENRIPYDFSIYFSELYKLALAGGDGPLERAQNQGFPAFFAAGKKGPPLEEGALAELVYQYLEALDSAPPGDMDYHYSLFYFFGRTFYLSETATVLVFLGAAALLLFSFLVYSLIGRRMLIIQWHIFRRRFWIAGLLFLLLALSLFLAELWSFLAKEFLALDGRADIPLAAAKVFCAIAFYNLLVPYFSRLRIPRKGNYFGSAAALLTLAGTMIAAVLDLSFVLLFLWACLFTLLGSLFRKAPLIAGAALLTPLELLTALVNLAGRGYTRIFELLNSGAVSITLYTALIVLPCFLLLHRAEYYSRRTGAGGPGRGLTGRLMAAGASLLVFFILALGLSRLPREGGERRIFLDEDETFFALKAESGVFLDRRVISLSLEAKEAPDLFTLELESPEQALIIYDTPMPYRFAPDNKSVSFILGEEPRNPFRTELVLPLDFSGVLRAGAVYVSPPDGAEGDISTVLRAIPVP